VRRLVAAFRRYFVEEPGGRWRFFHNSFRVFLCRQTARGWSGQYSEELDRQTHRDLADRFAAELADSPARWEELYHRVSACDHAGVCCLATQGYFRMQVFALRPLDAVRTDVEIALPSAAAQEDVRAYTALTLFHAEVRQRARLLHDFDLAGLLLDLGDAQAAAEAARDGNRLRIGNTRAMELASRLQEEGEAAEARRLFELGEPLDLLAGQGQHALAADAWRVLDAWAGTAPRFRPLEEILDMIGAAPLHELRLGSVGEGAEERFRCRLLTTAGLTLVASARWADLERLLMRLPFETAHGRQGQFWLLLEAARASERDTERCRHFLERLRGQFPADGLEPGQRVRLAEAIVQLSGERAAARELVEGLALPLPDLERPGQLGDGFDLFTPLLRHARLLAAPRTKRAVEAQHDAQDCLAQFPR
jgi:hypothetical protein